MRKLIGIVALTPERIIGSGGTLPWHLPADLAFFKRSTTGHPVIMGRKTYESIGRPLPKRHNIVLTQNTSWSAPGVEVIHQVSDVSALLPADSTAFVIGGSEVYRAFLPQIDELWISHVHQCHPGDTWFPEFESDFTGHEVMESHPEFTVKRWVRNH